MKKIFSCIIFLLFFLNVSNAQVWAMNVTDDSTHAYLRQLNGGALVIGGATFQMAVTDDSTHAYLRQLIALGSVDTGTNKAALSVYRAALLYQPVIGMQESTATSGTVSSNGSVYLLLTGAAASLTITAPTTGLVEGSLFIVTTNQTSISLTFTNSGTIYVAPPAAVTKTTSCRFVYSTVLSKWVSW